MTGCAGCGREEEILAVWGGHGRLQLWGGDLGWGWVKP